MVSFIGVRCGLFGWRHLVPCNVGCFGQCRLLLCNVSSIGLCLAASFVTVRYGLFSGGVIYYCAGRDRSGSVICYWAIWAVCCCSM